ncbi:hypothetical protein TPHA_0G01120 [Tetrapisispora phaffii CBS 4417]|uniref:Uncharacterized protein n=1 Tax=Tetrapisispora phaffii (strain ATCC 24235 / CBS 4417 / NBRC 1672 / NRRL Y-8282 / UCD 70-5) TaxID=1071381 RepID=G8BVM1_TETPH|nr:hypothetical protein TPHA_0G01120 [Tetrapisispora phaffii CBS 4417]CCE63949.1 hypothetical protein TPHA_0G01120 [Tetrapisispora phaffii CBS 4417]
MVCSILSTPPQNKISKNLPPKKPSKKNRLRELNLRLSDKCSPSTSKQHKYVTISNNSSSVPQYLNVEDDSFETDGEEEIFSSTDSRLSSPFSDNLTSPFVTPAFELKNDSQISNVTLNLIELINTSSTHSKNNKELQQEQQQREEEEQHQRKIPCHRNSKPKKSILVLPKDHLNLLVGSSKGSLDDATIYATEINASITQSSFTLPLITSTHEKITIPVNSEIKKKYKNFKRACLIKFNGSDRLVHDDISTIVGDIDCDDDDDNEPDEALIQGFKYESKDNNSKNDDNQKEKILKTKCTKKLRWE